MSRAAAQRECRAAIRSGLDAEAVVDGDVLRVRALAPDHWPDGEGARPCCLTEHPTDRPCSPERVP